MKQTFKRFLALMMSVCLFCVLSIPSAFAVSGNTRCYTIAAYNITAYRNSALSQKVGTIFPTDELQVLQVTSRYCKVSYPLSKGGRRTAFIPTSAILKGTGGSTVTASARFNTYRRAGGSSYGNVDQGDSVTLLGREGSWCQIKYPVSGGYKYAFVRASDFNRCCTSETSPQSGVSGNSERLAEIAAGEVGYQGTRSNGTGSGDYNKYGKWMGNNGVQWCAQFVSWCVNNAGVSTSIVPKSASTLSMARGSISYYSWSSSSMNNIHKGDVIFFSKTRQSLTNSNGGKSVDHVGIVYSVNPSAWTITIVEGNTSRDRVEKRSYTVNANTGWIKNYSSHYFCGYISVS